MSTAEEQPQPEREVITGETMLSLLGSVRDVNRKIATQEHLVKEAGAPIREALGPVAVANSSEKKEFDFESLDPSIKEAISKKAKLQAELDYAHAQLVHIRNEVANRLNQSLKPEGQELAKLVVTSLDSEATVIWNQMDPRSKRPMEVEGTFVGISRAGRFSLVSRHKYYEVRPFNEETGEPQVSIEIIYPEPAQNT